jgi:hypothetical protein
MSAREICTSSAVCRITLRQNGGNSVVGVIGSWNLVRLDDFVFNAQSGPN